MTRKLLKLPTAILSVLSMIAHATFPFNIKPVSVAERSMIMARLLETGKTAKQLKQDLIAIIDGDEEGELASFINSYPRVSRNTRVENLVMLFLGFVVSILLICSVIDVWV